MALPREIALDSAELDALMRDQWLCRIATRGPGERINLTPMWFGWGGGRIYLFARGQKVVNLRRDPVCSVVVDCNQRFPELLGASFQGQATILEDAAAEAADPHLPAVRQQMGEKYNGGGHGPAVTSPPPFAATATGRNRRWIVFEPQHVISWDNRKLGA